MACCAVDLCCECYLQEGYNFVSKMNMFPTPKLTFLFVDFPLCQSLFKQLAMSRHPVTETQSSRTDFSNK